MITVIVLGILLLIMGILLLVSPNTMSAVSLFLNRKVFDDSAVLGHRILVAIICLALGALLVSMFFGYHMPFSKM